LDQVGKLVSVCDQFTDFVEDGVILDHFMDFGEDQDLE
jgi:Ethanolamine utilization protein EutJ (predicted chaperonin)